MTRIKLIFTDQRAFAQSVFYRIQNLRKHVPPQKNHPTIRRRHYSPERLQALPQSPREEDYVKRNVIGSIRKNRGYDEFHALRNVSFSIKHGESIGIIGENGSGKSTLLKILAGVLYPDEGNVVVNGKIAPFLELGVDFQVELTAKENVFLYGSILGMTKKEMEAKYDEIMDFSELWQFENVKIKNFSSGMYARLAFAVAVEPDILLLDEVLAVGDEKFQMKCREKMNDFKKSGATIVLVSQSLSIRDRAGVMKFLEFNANS